jgi:membrane fusion protein (multidrug efflux system)
MSILDKCRVPRTINFLKIKKVARFLLLIFSGVFVIFISSSAISNATTTNFPPTLSPDNSLTNNVNTPEYVVIRASEEATFSSETTASVASLPVKEGSVFKIGDILLELDCRLQQTELNKTIAQQEIMHKALESARKLKSFGSISEFELVKASTDAKSADADVARLRVVVEKCTIKAPFNGAVAELMVHPYETVKQGDPLLKVVNTENLMFVIQVPSAWLTWLNIGSTFKVHINDIDKTITAKITYINPQIEPISQTVKITGIISPSDPALRPGMSGQAIFPDHAITSKDTTH